MTDIGARIRWLAHIARHGPHLLVLATRARASSPGSSRAQILLGTHHKVLTVFLGRVFRVFAGLTGRSYSLDMGFRLDYGADVLICHQSDFQFERLHRDWIGLHVRRDPRDMIVSAANYHVRSDEKWLHRPDDKFGGRTYQQEISALPDLEQRMLFEIDNASGTIIAQMAAWDYDRPGFTELRYEDLVGEHGASVFARAIADWPLTGQEKALLQALFRYFSIGAPGARRNTHIRNPAAGQWQKTFTPAVSDRFDQTLPDAVDGLGYGDEAAR